MSNNKDFKVKNGIQPTSYFEGVGTVVSAVEGYSLTGASYDSKSFSVVSQEGSPRDVSFKSDGTQMYICGTDTDSVFQYSLSTAWDVSTASYDSVSFSLSSQGLNPNGMFFKPDGTKVYVVISSNDTVFQYTLSTAWDLSTASYDSKSFSFASQDASPFKVSFKSDGTKMYVVGDSTDTIYQYSLSTAWDVSTATYDSISFSLSQDPQPWGFVFESDGSGFLILGYGNSSVFKYTLSTPWDIASSSYTNQSLSFGLDSIPIGLGSKPDGSKIYIVGDSNKTIYQYSTVLNTASLDLSTGSVFDYTPTSDVQVTLSNPADSGTVSAATLLLSGVAVSTDGYDLSVLSYDNKVLAVDSGTAANPEDVALSTDGTKMYVLYYQAAGADDKIWEYDLSTAWDVSTGTYSQEYNVSSISSWVEALTFKPDGTAFFLGASDDDMVKKVPLSTAWDISTATTPITNYETTVLVNVSGIAFKPDGTEMYITGQRIGPHGCIQQISMTTPWDLSTASSTKVEDIDTQTLDPWSISISDDGTTIIILSDNDGLYEYTLSTAWDLSTISYASVTKSLSTENNTMHGIHHRADGVKMYAVGWANDHEVHQYTTGTETAATITYDSSVEFSGGTAPTSPDVGDTDVITFSTRDGGTTYQAVQAIDGAV